MIHIITVSLLWALSILGLCLSITWNDIEIEQFCTLIFVLLSGILPSLRKYDKVMNDISLQSSAHVLSGVLASLFYGISVGLLDNHAEVGWLFTSLSTYTILIGYTHWVFTEIDDLTRVLRVSIYSLLVSVCTWVTTKGIDDYNQGRIGSQDLIISLIGFWILAYILVVLVRVHFFATNPSIYGEFQEDESQDESEDEQEEDEKILLRI